MKKEKIRLFLGASILLTVSLFFFCRGYFLRSHRSSGLMVKVPGGDFIMGSDDTGEDLDGIEGASTAKVFAENESPRHKTFLDTYYIDKYEVTNAAYLDFLMESRQSAPRYWENGTYKSGRENHPVQGVSWFEANSYCIWAGKRLPSESEWEKAARGPRGNIYTWGNTFSISKGNFNKGDTVPVGSIGTDKSYYGVFDLAGNLLEWTSSWYKAYEGARESFNEYGEFFRVIRGATGISSAHYNLPGVFTRASNRLFFPPDQNAKTIGFRCAKDSQ